MTSLLGPGRRGRPHAPVGTRLPSWRWALFGLIVGAAGSLTVWAPASTMAQAIAALSGSRLVLAEPTGTWWSGSAQLVLTGGEQSIDRVALAHRLQWQWAWGRTAQGERAVKIRLWHPKAIPQTLTVSVAPRWSGVVVQVEPAESPANNELSLPAAWLTGLGTPWNTLQPSGTIALQAERLRWEWTSGQTHITETLLLMDLRQMASRVSTLPVLGHYELRLQQTPSDSNGLRLTLSSRADSLLKLHGVGRWQPGQRLEFRGEAQASQGHEAALANLLNIIGRREGPRSVIAL